MSATHDLKLKAEWFQRVVGGEKTAEIRLHDRDYQVDDEIRFIEVNASQYNRPTGRFADAVIYHVLPHCLFPEGLREGYCLLSFGLVSEPYEATEDRRES